MPTIVPFQEFAEFDDDQRGPTSGSTAPHNRKDDLRGLWKGGEDSLELSLYVEWSEESFERNQSILSRCQQGALEEVNEGEPFFSLGGWTFEVQPGGCRVGRSYFAYSVLGLGMRFYISRSPCPRGDWANVRVVIGSETLTRRGGRGAYQLVREFVAAFGGRLLTAKVSRVDACVDCLNVDMQTFATAFEAGNYLCRSRNDHCHRNGGQINSIRFGQSKVVCRIYDKLLELEQKPDPSKEQAIIERSCDGERPEHLTRVEFQLRREALKAYGVDTVEDWFDRREGVLRDLCSWLWFPDLEGKEDFDKSNAQRLYDAIPEWQEVERSFRYWATSAVDYCVRDHGVDRPADPVLLEDMALGCLIASYATSHVRWDYAAFMLFSSRVLADAVARKTEGDLERKFQNRVRRQHAVSVPAWSVSPTATAVIEPFNTWADQYIRRRARWMAEQVENGQVDLFDKHGGGEIEIHRLVGD